MLCCGVLRCGVVVSCRIVLCCVVFVLVCFCYREIYVGGQDGIRVFDAKDLTRKREFCEKVVNSISVLQVRELTAAVTATTH